MHIAIGFISHRFYVVSPGSQQRDVQRGILMPSMLHYIPVTAYK